MSDRCNEIEKKFEDFKDLYAQNNKEFLTLAFSVQELRDKVTEYMDKSEKYRKEREELEAPMIKWFSGMSFLKSFIMGTAIFGTTVIGFYFIIKKLLQ